MNKLLISLLSLTGVAGISTGGYFLLRGNEKSEQKTVVSNEGEAESGKLTGTDAQENGGVGAAGANAASPPQLPSQPSSDKKEE